MSSNQACLNQDSSTLRKLIRGESVGGL
ncbi:MAG: hypothetical protein ACI9TY_001408, partial [Alphaproteobacteria bacterium]